MATQTASNVQAAIKREVAGTPGVAAVSGAGASLLRLVDSPGSRLDRGQIQSNERRDNMIRPMGRLGGKSVGGSYAAEFTIGGATDLLLESILRTSATAALVVPQATFGAGATATTSASGANTLVTFSAGNPIALGYRVGDIVTFTGFTGALVGLNNIRLRIIAITTTSFTVAGAFAFSVSAGAWTLTALKKIKTPTTPTRHSYTVEQYLEDIDLSEIFLGMRLVGLAISFRPNAIVSVTYTFVGMNRTALLTGTSPWFTGPTGTTGVPLVADDSAIRFNGIDVSKFTAMDLNLAIDNSVTPVIGSVVPPDVYDNRLTISGTISVIREDFNNISMYDAEQSFELSGLFTEPGVDPKSCFGFFLPNVRFTSLDAPFLGGDGPMIESLAFMVDTKGVATGYDDTAINFFSSAP